MLIKYEAPLLTGVNTVSKKCALAVDIAINVALISIAIYIFSSTVYGIINAYSPIPVMDQWDAYRFYHDVTHGDYAAWWRPHNEHRILLSRILFYIDIRFFNGTNKFLLIVDFLMLSSLVAVFGFHSRLNSQEKPSIVLAIFLPAALLYSWVQYNNLTWGYQSQFFAVYLFAACAFFSMPNMEGKTWRDVYLVWIFAILSMLSMSNGILVFPVLVIQLLLTRIPTRKLWLPCIIWVACWVLYFFHYTKPGGHAIHLNALEHLWALIRFYCVFLGSPAYFFFHNFWSPGLIGFIFSIFMIGGAALLYRRGNLTPYRASLFALWFFIALSAFAASTGRYLLGLEMAVSSRYTTPALVGWAASLFFLVDCLNVRARRSFLLIMLLPLFVLASYQHHSDDPVPDNHYRAVGVLSIKMGVDDKRYFPWLLPIGMSNILLDITHIAEKERIGIYGSGWLSKVGSLKFDKSNVKEGICAGELEASEQMPGAYRLSGWTTPSNTGVGGKLILLVNSKNATVGTELLESEGLFMARLVFPAGVAML